MSTLMESVTNDPSSTLSYSNTSTNDFRIKRVGARPLSFHGIELAMAMSFTPSIPYWYEINIYRTTEHKFVLAIRLFFQSSEEEDSVQAWQFESLTDALEKIKSYDPAQDVRVDFDAEQPMAIADLTAKAMFLHAKTSAARSHYASLIGEFFYSLEQS